MSVKKILFRIEHGRFFYYFKDVEFGIALQITDLVIYDDPIDPYEISDSFIPPQSFHYFDENLLVDK